MQLSTTSFTASQGASSYHAASLQADDLSRQLANVVDAYLLRDDACAKQQTGSLQQSFAQGGVFSKFLGRTR